MRRSLALTHGQRTAASLMIARPNAPVAQLDRVAASEAAGRWFESSRARQPFNVYSGYMGNGLFRRNDL
jgi:hypothetical protein